MRLMPTGRAERSSAYTDRAYGGNYHPYVRARRANPTLCDVWHKVACRNSIGEGLLVTGEQPLVSVPGTSDGRSEYRPSQVERRHGGSIVKEMVWLNMFINKWE